MQWQKQGALHCWCYQQHSVSAIVNTCYRRLWCKFRLKYSSFLITDINPTRVTAHL